MRSPINSSFTISNPQNESLPNISAFEKILLLPFVITTLSVEELLPTKVSFTSSTFSLELSRLYVVLVSL